MFEPEAVKSKAASQAGGAVIEEIIQYDLLRQSP